MPYWIHNLIVNLYVKTLGSRSMQRANDKLLQLALHGRGYNNFGRGPQSGEANFIRILSTFKPRYCIDIGANTGNYSRMLLALPGTKVVAFEPLPEAFKSLEAMRNEFPGRFECFNLGVADKEGVLTLHFGEKDSELASFSSEVNNVGYVGQSNVNKIESQVVTLDGFLEKREAEEIDLLKIDTEGYESEVLMGAAKTLRDNPPKFVQLEFNHHHLFRLHSLYSLSKLLPAYKTYQVLSFGNGLALRDPSLPESNIYHFSNFIFVREDIARKL
jgi:FkbM family methyltransferase